MQLMEGTLMLRLLAIMLVLVVLCVIISVDALFATFLVMSIRWHTLLLGPRDFFQVLTRGLSLLSCGWSSH